MSRVPEYLRGKSRESKEWTTIYTHVARVVSVKKLQDVNTTHKKMLDDMDVKVVKACCSYVTRMKLL
jgi:hypothetical protein